jgi:hypothetical protein
MPNPKECAPTLTRMNKFVRNPVLRRMFECPDPRLNIADVMNKRQILLVNIAPLSDESKTVATLLVGKIRQAALEREEIPQSQRIPFHVYADEFQFYQTSDFDEILSFAGGYGLRLTIANQYFSKLTSEIQGGIDGNVGSFIIFKIGKKDLSTFSSFLPPDYPPDTLLRMPKYHALYKIGDDDSVIKPTPPPRDDSLCSHADYIRKRTLELYARNTAQGPYPSGGGSEKPDPEPTDDPREARGAPPTRGILRPPEQGRRPPGATKNPDQKRP